MGTTTVLMISNVTEEDYGNYTCVATNRLGIQNASLFLYSKWCELASVSYTVRGLVVGTGDQIYVINFKMYIL